MEMLIAKNNRMQSLKAILDKSLFYFKYINDPFYVKLKSQGKKWQYKKCEDLNKNDK